MSFSRRTFLAGAASSVALAACGGDSSSTATTAPGTPTSGGGPDELVLVQFFGNDTLRPGLPQRAVFGLADDQGVLTGTAPDAAEIAITRNGTVLASEPAVAKRADGLPRPYYPITFTPDEPGIYEAVATVGALSTRPAAFQVVAVDAVRIPQVGEPMRPFETPTVADPKGVTELCTREPVCPLHDVTLTAALGEGRPVAFLISTPEFCQFQTCGPVLDFLLSARSAFPEIRMVHSEVWPDEASVLKTKVPVVEEYGLTFEPCLFVARADGTVAARLDNVFDAAELADTLALV